MFICAASMACVSVSAQDIYHTAAGVPMVQLNNGILMPQFGLGTFLQPSDEVCKQSCLTALRAGYRASTPPTPTTTNAASERP